MESSQKTFSSKIKETEDVKATAAALKSLAANPENFDYMKFAMMDMARCKLKYTVNPEEAFMSMMEGSEGNTTTVYELSAKFQELQNKFFLKMWQDLVLPYITPESLVDYVMKMTKSEFGEFFATNLMNDVSLYDCHRESVEEMRAQRDAGELDEGQDDW
jgi:hypothetical protein